MKKNTESKNQKPAEALNVAAVMRSCSFCEFYRHEKIRDSDIGGVYAENPSCSKYYDTDQKTEDDIPNFDRTIERDCCKLDFWSVLGVDRELSEKLSIEQDKNEGSFSETYELFKVRYNYV
jgi:hypothetical protein